MDNFYAKYSGAGGGSDPNAIDGLTGEVIATGPGTVPAVLADGLTLRDGSGNPSVDTDNRTLIDSAGNNSVDYEQRFLIDSASELSIDYENRILQDADENEQLTYDSNGVGLPQVTPSSALTTDAGGYITASSTTDVELGYVSGVTSAIQTQINSKQSTSEKGFAFGYASLDSGGKVPVAQLPSTLMEYKGAWSAATNTPTLADGTGDNGDVYRVSVAGTQNLGSGANTYFVGDFVIYNGSIWQRSPAADGVISVNGASGAVTVNAINQLTGDVTAGPASGSASAVATLATVASAGTTGSSTAIPVVTINAKGLTTSITTAAVVAPAGTLTGTTLASNVVTSSLTSVGTISTGVWQGTVVGTSFGGMGTQTTEDFTLNGTNISNQYIDLAHTAVTGSISNFKVVGLGPLFEGASFDYTVSYAGGSGGVTRITFANDLATGGASALISGDKIQLNYRY